MPKPNGIQVVSASIVVCLSLIHGCSRQVGEGIKEIGEQESKKATISVTIDFADQQPLVQFKEVACQEGMTILEIMQELQTQQLSPTKNERSCFLFWCVH